MRVLKLLLMLLGFSLAVPATAAERFDAYDGPDIVTIGKGGTKVVRNGIEYWTLGMPPRPFRVIGVIKDSRTNRWWDGDPIGSKAIAKLTRTANGNAVVVVDSNTNLEAIESYYSGCGGGSAVASNNWASWSGGFFGSGSTSAVNRTNTRLLVIRYLTDEELAAAPEALKSSEESLQLLAPAQAAASVRPSLVSAPAKRPARTPSGFCYEVPRDYRGLGSLNRPALSTNTPACWQVAPDGQN